MDRNLQCSYTIVALIFEYNDCHIRRHLIVHAVASFKNSNWCSFRFPYYIHLHIYAVWAVKSCVERISMWGFIRASDEFGVARQPYYAAVRKTCLVLQFACGTWHTTVAVSRFVCSVQTETCTPGRNAHQLSPIWNLPLSGVCFSLFTGGRDDYVSTMVCRVSLWLNSNEKSHVFRVFWYSGYHFLSLTLSL